MPARMRRLPRFSILLRQMKTDERTHEEKLKPREVPQQEMDLSGKAYWFRVAWGRDKYPGT